MKTLNNTWTGRNRKGEYWTNVTGQWIMATTPYQIEIMKDIMNVSKIKSIDMTTHFNSLVLTLGNTVNAEPTQTNENEDETLPMYKPNHLVRFLKDTNQKLTKLEIKTLECILSQGSFYEE